MTKFSLIAQSKKIKKINHGVSTWRKFHNYTGKIILINIDNNKINKTTKTESKIIIKNNNKGNK